MIIIPLLKKNAKINAFSKANKKLVAPSRLFSFLVNPFKDLKEYIFYDPAYDIKNIKALQELNPGVSFVRNTKYPFKDKNSLIWSLFNKDFEVDSTILEPFYDNKDPLSIEINIQKWKKAINDRNKLGSNYMCKSKSDPETPKFGDCGGKLWRELDQAISIVSRASYISRSYQQKFRNFNTMDTKQSVNKLDKSPVTIADFAVQAIIIDHLKKHFTDDHFIAEENSDILVGNYELTNSILDLVEVSIGERWTDEKLFSIIDQRDSSSSHSSNSKRVWVIDPIDGTKGFIRGEHYCIALALLIDGDVKLSVMGCPNLNLLRVIGQGAYDDKPLGFVDPSYEISSRNRMEASAGMKFFSHLDAGSIYFAVSGFGAFAKSLSMPVGSAIEVQVSDQQNPKELRLCESVEASHGNRFITQSISQCLGMKNDYIRLDGQCKYCVVGAGAAEGTLRLPPKGYQERIWDHAPGYLYVREAGGTVSDLQGRSIDFSQGSYLDKCVTGIVITNGRLHTQLVEAVNKFL